jgi:hypothetical protein
LVFSLEAKAIFSLLNATVSVEMALAADAHLSEGELQHLQLTLNKEKSL